MSGRSACASSRGIRRVRNIAILLALYAAGLAPTLPAQERREREANSVYAERRAKLIAQVTARSFCGDSPVAKKPRKPIFSIRKTISII